MDSDDKVKVIDIAGDNPNYDAEVNSYLNYYSLAYGIKRNDITLTHIPQHIRRTYHRWAVVYNGCQQGVYLRREDAAHHAKMKQLYIDRQK